MGTGIPMAGTEGASAQAMIEQQADQQRRASSLGHIARLLLERPRVDEREPDGLGLLRAARGDWPESARSGRDLVVGAARAGCRLPAVLDVGTSVVCALSSVPSMSPTISLAPMTTSTLSTSEHVLPVYTRAGGLNSLV